MWLAIRLLDLRLIRAARFSFPFTAWMICFAMALSNQASNCCADVAYVPNATNMVEPSRTGQASKAQQSRAEQSSTEPSRAEPSRAGGSRAGEASQSKAGQGTSRAGQSMAGNGKAESRAGQDRAESKARQYRAGQGKARQGRAFWSGDCTGIRVRLCFGLGLRKAYVFPKKTLCYVMLCYAMLCYVKS